MFTNKLAPTYKDSVLSQEPDSLNTATHTVRAMWKRKNLAGHILPKEQSLTMSLSTLEIESSMQQLNEDIWEECIMAIKNKRTNTYLNIK